MKPQHFSMQRKARRIIFMIQVPSTGQQASHDDLIKRTRALVPLFTGVLLILSVVGFFLPFVILLFGLDFLDQPASVALSIFRQQSATVLLSYYAYVSDGLFLSLAVSLLYRVLQSR